MCACRACCMFTDVYFVLFLFCLYICACIFLQIQGPLRDCRSIRSGYCRSLHYCAPLVCVPAVIGVLAAWWRYKLKTRNQKIQGRGTTWGLVRPRMHASPSTLWTVLHTSREPDRVYHKIGRLRSYIYVYIYIYATVQELLCHGSYCEHILSHRLAQASCRLSFVARPPAGSTKSVARRCSLKKTVQIHASS